MAVTDLQFEALRDRVINVERQFAVKTATDEAIEQGTPATIALLSLDPDPATRTLRIVAEARTSDAMLGFVELLKQQPFFSSAVLVKHEVSDQDPNQPLRFQVDVQWTNRRMP